jgi:membrane-bound ClpP family serine protease
MIFFYFLWLLSPFLFSEEIPSSPQTIGYIHIGDHETAISQSTWIYVKSALDHYKKTKPAFVILHLNTPGGEVFAAQKISDALKNFDTQEGIPVVALIDNWAISAGAMLAYSSKEIVTVKDGIMGAAEPVTLGQSGQMEKASEKVNSAIRADFGARASFFDRNPLIAEAMVDSDMILVKRDGKIVSLDKEEMIQSSDQVISRKGKLLTLDAKGMKELGIVNFILQPKKLEPITQEEKLKGVWSFKKELLFQDPSFQKYSKAVVDKYQMDFKTALFAWLSHPMVVSALSLGLMVGFYMEMNTPGFGVAGIVAITCLALMILSSFALEIGEWLKNIDYEFNTGTFNAAGEALMTRLAWLSVTFLLGCLLIALLAKFIMPRLYLLSRLVLVGSEQEGYFAGVDPKNYPKVGSQGTVLSTLRPSGKIEVEGDIYEAMTEGSFIEKGEAVVVTRVMGSAVVVERRFS